MTRQTFHLDAVVDPHQARVLYRRGSDGRIRDARFDLSGVPRVDPLLQGKPVDQVPTLVARLCGLCPVTHYLAGMAALDVVNGFEALTPTARAVRRLLHHGSVLEVMVPRFVSWDREAALVLRRLGREALTVAGCPGHFPEVACPGGVRAPAGDTATLATMLEPAVAALNTLSSAVAADPMASLGPVAQQSVENQVGVLLVGEDGAWDPLGQVLRIVRGTDIVEVPVARIPDVIRETRPGEAAPRPQVQCGEAWYPYRVGPAVRYPSLSPRLAQLESLRDTVGAIVRLLEDSSLTSGECVAPQSAALVSPCATGAIDGPRGILVHTYDTDGDGTLNRCTILTPTAQNEGWLARMLESSLDTEKGVEQAIRAADPCLPCTLAPEGLMPVECVEEAEEE